MRDSLDVGVVGCGYAGGAAALALARAGHRVTVYEAVETPGPVGAGIVLQPTGLAALARLGLDAAVIARGSPLHGLHCRTPRDHTVLDLDYGDLAPGLFGLGLHRGALFEILYDAVRAEGITVHCGIACEGLTQPVQGKRAIVDTAGRTHGPHDLVVVADGARSSLRDDASLTRRVKSYPYGALWYVAEAPDDLADDALMQTCEGTRTLLGLLPSGLGPRRAPGEKDRRLVTLFWSVRVDAAEALKNAGLEAFRREAVRVDPRSAPVVAQLRSMDELLLSTYLDVVMDDWHTSGLVYLGDAAHAMSPQLGQGCNLALVDAMVLADSLAANPTLTEGLSHYTRARRAHLRFYQFASRWLTPFFQSDLRFLGAPRDWLMGWMCRLPYFRGQMIRSMVGIKRGILRPSIALPPAPRLLASPRES